MADLAGSRPPLTTLVKIGGPVPGENGAVFTNVGEGLSFDGRFLAFWGTWGTETKTLVLVCRQEGMAERVAYCRQRYPNGYTTTVPLHQGIFVYDVVKGTTTPVAKAPGEFDDFLYWNFSGFVPGTGESDEEGEPARWRAASFMAVSGLVNGQLSDATFHVAFKARKGPVASGRYVNPVDGLYLSQKPGQSPLMALVKTGMDGVLFDPAAIEPETQSHLPVTEMGHRVRRLPGQPADNQYQHGYRGGRLGWNLYEGGAMNHHTGVRAR